mgnify:CR=1 FL=1
MYSYHAYWVWPSTTKLLKINESKYELGNSELSASESLTKAPIGGSNVVGHTWSAIWGDNTERERLPNEDGANLPIHAPIALHGEPFGAWALNKDGFHVSCTPYIKHHDQVEVGVSVDHKTNPPLLHTCHPTFNEHIFNLLEFSKYLNTTSSLCLYKIVTKF